MDFKLTFFNVLIVLVYAIPGFILIKTKLAKEEHISILATVLLYIFSPAMVIYSFQGINYSNRLLIHMLLFIGVTLITQVIIIFLFYLFTRKKYSQTPSIRVGSLGVALGNVGFFGLPLILALLKDYPEAKIYSTMFVISMNFIAFTLGSFALTGDKKYMKLKNAILNPTTIPALLCLPLFIFDVKIENLMGSFGPILNDAITLLAKMTTPTCMIILGMRLATASLKEIFIDYKVYLISIIKMVVFPLMSYLLVYFIPGIDYSFKASILILSSAPVASIILNLAEMLGSEQKYAANMVLISTLLSIITIPLVLLVL